MAHGPARSERPRRPRLAWTFVLACAAGGCHPTPARRPPQPTAAVSSDVGPLARALGTAVPATTDGTIAVRNLESQLRSSEARLARRADDAGALADVIELLLARAQYLGRCADYERALESSERLVIAAPSDARSWLLRGSARASLHEFEGALADLERAAVLGASPAALAGARADILDATGQSEAALALRSEVIAHRPTITSLAALATAQALAGEEEQAQALFRRALASYRDVSPFPVAWLLVQRGLSWERGGDAEGARAAFALAHERLPTYAAAASGLARLDAAGGDHAAAAELLRELTTTSDDPEYLGQLAAEVHALGDDAGAERLRERAASELDALVARHPDAFIAKEVRFWLGPGADPERGFALAKHNLATRGSTPPALALAAEAALAAQKAAPRAPAQG